MNQANAAIGKYRWTICGLVFFATTVNYLDRNVISYLRPFLAEAFHWTPEQEVIDYSNIELAFKIAYALGMLVAGGIIDKLGTKLGYAIATGLWSLAAIGHALATGTGGFLIARVFLGITEAGNFPAAIKATAEWFPQKERALATGIFNSGSNIGAIIVPLTVPFIAENYGWQWAFILTGIVGFVWLVLWFLLYEIPQKQKRLSQAELNYITSDKVETTESEDTEKVSWRKLLSFRQTWAFAIGKLLTDPVWWFYLFWLPDFLMKQYKLSSTEIIWPCALVYMIGSIGSIGGGWLPLKLINNNWPAYKARKISMLLYAFAVLPVLFSQYLGAINMWLAVLVIGFAVSAHQAWSANIFTTVSDMFPKKATASVTGIGGMFGALGGILLTLVVQKNMFVYYTKIGQIETGYFIMFCICGASYLLAWLIMHLLVPRMKKVEL
ncbi:MFS transporter [Flavobacterium circumlabens]|uniref:MFS transporter n=1 Tax=Flavobacterium circumlabens TaxID=2133765 RepID=A0A4Y7U8K5_9FLAO|nr:MFS transporter [Flavobacterium circumlabens]TCN54576.1 ACS family hexuronate transporter-like MFS transporter [Flavobacterium circumlabens]TEB42776.1 MFS transporter [Flavobacterium circumlabens]